MTTIFVFVWWLVGAIKSFNDFKPDTIGGVLACLLLAAWGGPLVLLYDILKWFFSIKIRK